jgi:broad specificity phosphatase PhoE
MLLGFGEVTASPDLAEGGHGDAPDANNWRAQAFRKLVATLPPADNNVVIVTHKPNIVDALGKDWANVREGEASVFEPDGTGGYRLIARVQASEWGSLAQGLD